MLFFFDNYFFKKSKLFIMRNQSQDKRPSQRPRASEMWNQKTTQTQPILPSPLFSGITIYAFSATVPLLSPFHQSLSSKAKLKSVSLKKPSIHITIYGL